MNENLIQQIRNVQAESILKNSDLLSLPDISDETKSEVCNILERGMIDGNNPKEVALELVGRIDPITKKRVGGIITLSPQQFEEKRQVFQWLEQLDDCYLSVKVRDKRYDRTIKKAINLKQPLSSEKIDSIMIAYENRALKQRADVIVQTEMMKSLNRASYIAHLQTVYDGSHYKRMG